MKLKTEAARRRTFAIISHPDAGKTTLTEKLLYYGGAIQEAGAVRARRGAKAATSDWMEMEKQRKALFGTWLCVKVELSSFIRHLSLVI